MPVRRHFAITLLLASVALVPNVVRADAAADRQAELDRKKQEAKKKADERKAKAAADKAAADKAAADKAAAGGATGAGGSAASTTAGGTASGGATTAAGGSAGKAGSGGAAGAAGAAGKGGAGGAATKADEKDAPLPAVDIETLRKDRTDRRTSTVARLRKRWGSLLANEKGTADLKLHARRVAFLQRIRAVASSKKDTKSVEVVDELLTQEDERHTKAMNSLREGALP
jgi:hypothetical protein